MFKDGPGWPLHRLPKAWEVGNGRRTALANEQDVETMPFCSELSNRHTDVRNTDRKQLITARNK